MLSAGAQLISAGLPKCLPHCCRRTLHQQARGRWIGGTTLLHTHTQPPTQAREWLQRCSLPTPRFRKSIDSHRARVRMSLLVGQAGRRARGRTSRGGRGARARQRHSALAKYARRGTSQSLHIPRYCTLLFLPPTSSTPTTSFCEFSQFRNFSWFPRRDFRSHCPFSRLTGSTLRLTIN
jgi:hypothetical protein